MKRTKRATTFQKESTPNYEHKVMKNAREDDACVLSIEEFLELSYNLPQFSISAISQSSDVQFRSFVWRWKAKIKGYNFCEIHFFQNMSKKA